MEYNVRVQYIKDGEEVAKVGRVMAENILEAMRKAEILAVNVLTHKQYVVGVYVHEVGATS